MALIPAILPSNNTLIESLGNFLFTETTIESPNALPMLCIFTFNEKLASATEIIFGLTNTIGSSIA